MPQLSLYLSDENMTALRARAGEEGISMSKHVNRLIERDVQGRGWPRGFWDLYGAIQDDSFEVPPDALPADDAQFEALFV